MKTQDGVKRKQLFCRSSAAESDHFIDVNKMIYTPTEWRFCSDFNREYKYNREIAKAVVEHIQLRGYDASLVVPEETDISLKERCMRINRVAIRFGHEPYDTFVVSIHVNAAGSGGMWHNATGWCAYTFLGHTESDKLASCLYKAAERYLPGHRLRTDYCDGDPDFEAPFYILKHTYCAAVLTENGFMDCELSLRYLESEEDIITGRATYIKECRDNCPPEPNHQYVQYRTAPNGCYTF